MKINTVVQSLSALAVLHTGVFAISDSFELVASRPGSGIDNAKLGDYDSELVISKKADPVMAHIDDTLKLVIEHEGNGDDDYDDCEYLKIHKDGEISVVENSKKASHGWTIHDGYLKYIGSTKFSAVLEKYGYDVVFKPLSEDHHHSSSSFQSTDSIPFVIKAVDGNGKKVADFPPTVEVDIKIGHLNQKQQYDKRQMETTIPSSHTTTTSSHNTTTSSKPTTVTSIVPNNKTSMVTTTRVTTSIPFANISTTTERTTTHFTGFNTSITTTTPIVTPIFPINTTVVINNNNTIITRTTQSTTSFVTVSTTCPECTVTTNSIGSTVTLSPVGLTTTATATTPCPTCPTITNAAGSVTVITPASVEVPSTSLAAEATTPPISNIASIIGASSVVTNVNTLARSTTPAAQAVSSTSSRATLAAESISVSTFEGAAISGYTTSRFLAIISGMLVFIIV